MPIIRPVSDLRNKFKEISEVCHEEGKPVFLTKNGHGDMVVMSIALYEKQQALLELYERLGTAEIESDKNTTLIPHTELIKQLKDKIDDQA
jgi:prevent-host-death family protein